MRRPRRFYVRLKTSSCCVSVICSVDFVVKSGVEELLTGVLHVATRCLAPNQHLFAGTWLHLLKANKAVPILLRPILFMISIILFGGIGRRGEDPVQLGAEQCQLVEVCLP